MNASQNTFSDLADKVATAKSEAGEVLQAWPAEIEGYSDLERAVSLLGDVGQALDAAADDPDGHL